MCAHFFLVTFTPVPLCPETHPACPLLCISPALFVWVSCSHSVKETSLLLSVSTCYPFQLRQFQMGRGGGGNFNKEKSWIWLEKFIKLLYSVLMVLRCLRITMCSVDLETFEDGSCQPADSLCLLPSLSLSALSTWFAWKSPLILYNPTPPLFQSLLDALPTAADSSLAWASSQACWVPFC